jgi:glycosyltransferase involved in cell wall biosynthesis
MQLLHVTPHYYPAWSFGGTARVAYELTRQLAARGHEVTVFTTDTLDARRRIAGAPGPVDVEGVRVFYFRNWTHALSARLNLSTPRAMRRAARELAPGLDLVHCHELRTVENLHVVPVAAHVGVPLVLSPHGTLPHETGRGAFKRWWDRLFGRRLAGSFAHMAALTAHEAEQTRALWRWLRLPAGDLHVQVIPNGIDMADFDDLPPREVFRARYGIPADALLVLFLGRLHPRKGVDLLARAVEAVPGAWLAVVGPDEGAQSDIEALAQALGISDRVTLTGYLDGADKLAALAAADVFALAAVGEGLPMAALEAGAAGLPLLLSPECYLPAVEEAGAGWVLPRRPAAWSDGLRRLLTDADLCASMGHSARDMVAARFTWSAVLDRLESFYESILG